MNHMRKQFNSSLDTKMAQYKIPEGIKVVPNFLNRNAKWNAYIHLTKTITLWVETIKEIRSYNYMTEDEKSLLLLYLARDLGEYHTDLRASYWEMLFFDLDDPKLDIFDDGWGYLLKDID